MSCLCSIDIREMSLEMKTLCEDVGLSLGVDDTYNYFMSCFEDNIENIVWILSGIIEDSSEGILERLRANALRSSVIAYALLMDYPLFTRLREKGWGSLYG